MAVALRSQARPGWLVRPAVGMAAWVIALAGLPAPFAARVFLAAPLVIVPLLLETLPRRPLVGRVEVAWLASAPALVAGLSLAGALSLEPGPLAAALALPWTLLAGSAGLAALRHGLPRLSTLLLPGRAAELATDAALGFLAVGGLFVLADRLGASVVGFAPPYTLLGAIHYHFAGFGLLALIAILASRSSAATGRQQSAAWLAAMALVAGVVVTAAGLITASAPVNWIGALLVGLGGYLFVGLLLLTGKVEAGWRRLGLWAAAIALGFGVAMGVAHASALLLGVGFVGMDVMVRSHGVLNASAVLLAVGALTAAQRARR